MLMWKFFNNKILNGLNGQSQTITSAAIILAVASLASRFLGLIRDRLLAGQFGAGDTLDIYYAAFRIPDLVYNLLILGALSAGFIPVFVSLWQKGERDEKAWQFVNSILNILLVGLIILGGLFFIFAPYLMKLITPGFSGEKFNLTVQLTRIMFLSPLLLGISGIWGGVLQSLKRFFVFSLAPIFYNLGIIFGILFLVPRFGIYGLAYGVVLGAFLHMVIQLPTLLSLGFRWRPVFNWADEGMRRLTKLMVPRTLTLAVSQLNFVAITILASGLAAGSLAVFNLSFNIWSFPLGILAASLAIAAFPILSQNAATKDRQAFAKTFSVTFRQILFLIIPASALFIVLRAQIVRVVLGTGKFDWTDTILTFQSLQYLTLGLFAEALILLLIRGFFALEDTKTPFWLGLFSSAVRIFGAWIFAAYLGVPGLALGYALGGVAYLILLWIFLERKVGDLNFREILNSGLKIFLASFLAGMAAYLMLQVMDKFVNTHKVLGIFAQGLAAGIVGIIVYFLAGLILRSQEMWAFYRSLKNRLPFKTVAPDKELIQE
ncbi:murein biosynthesis integral membrane protein MurJ [Patescibacteria group bacterium]|nr:murein biosynthesis integral membrane protein MurJ [Patescibacteria group bacterium]